MNKEAWQHYDCFYLCTQRTYTQIANNLKGVKGDYKQENKKIDDYEADFPS